MLIQHFSFKSVYFQCIEYTTVVGSTVDSSPVYSNEPNRVESSTISSRVKAMTQSLQIWWYASQSSHGHEKGNLGFAARHYSFGKTVFVLYFVKLCVQLNILGKCNMIQHYNHVQGPTELIVIIRVANFLKKNILVGRVSKLQYRLTATLRRVVHYCVSQYLLSKLRLLRSAAR